jgi:hypothetical protein
MNLRVDTSRGPPFDSQSGLLRYDCKVEIFTENLFRHEQQRQCNMN